MGRRMRPSDVVPVVAAALVAWPVVGYPAVLRWLGRRRPPTTTSGVATADLPSVSVIVPTFEEEVNIVARLDDLALTQYPLDRLEVIVVDSGSTDGTLALARAWAARSRELSVLVVAEDERRGKASAINTGIGFAGGDVIVVTDAPTGFEPTALRRVVEAFADPAIGAATGWFEVTGEGTGLQAQEQRFWHLRNTLRRLEAEVDSTPFLSGELCAFRRDVVNRLDTDTLADDMNVALQARALGFRSVVVPDARFWERRTGSASELLSTKGRRAAGGIQELLRFRTLVSPRHGTFGLLILPSAMLYYVPVRIPAALVVGWRLRGALRAVPRPLRPLVALAAAAAAWRWRRELEVALFSERVLVDGWRRVLRGQMDVRWSQERSSRVTSPEAGAAAGAPRSGSTAPRPPG